MNALQREIRNTFFQTLEDLKTKKNFETFLTDFLNDKELETLVKRLAIAYWLKKNRDLKNIKTNLGVSLSEIKDAQKKMDSKGIKLALNKLEAEEWSNVWSQKIKSFIKNDKRN